LPPGPFPPRLPAPNMRLACGIGGIRTTTACSADDNRMLGTGAPGTRHVTR
ncbi:MAG: hypothetical protein K0R97_2555, partial [Oerskovia sp.]|nr:hypothetical protein [Oerskovia sp.]